MLEIEKGSPLQIGTAITFNSDVRLRRTIYRDARNSIRKSRANSDVHNFKHKFLIHVHNISRPRNIRRKPLPNSNGHKF